MNDRLCHHRDTCRACGSCDLELVLDLGEQPCANALPADAEEGGNELRFPLQVYFCTACSLVQLLDVVNPEHLFGHYLYLTGMSDMMRVHFADYAQSVAKEAGLLDTPGLVVDVASNDGSLLKAFQNLGCPVLGVEPARNVAALAQEAGVPTDVMFFDEAAAEVLRERHGPARVSCANNVLAHVDDPVGFLKGMKALVAPDGHVVVEAPQLWYLVENLEYDTIYHEHLSYFSLTALQKMFRAAGLSLTHVQEQAVHGGSLRCVARPVEVIPEDAGSVHTRLAAEAQMGLADLDRLKRFAAGCEDNRRQLKELIRGLRSDGASIAAYGAPAKGNTLLNYCGLTPDDIAFTVDRNPLKQGRLLPGSHIPVLKPEEILRRQPDYVIILPWNIADEIVAQQAEYRRRGGRFVVPIPRPRILA